MRIRAHDLEQRKASHSCAAWVLCLLLLEVVCEMSVGVTLLRCSTQTSRAALKAPVIGLVTCQPAELTCAAGSL